MKLVMGLWVMYSLTKFYSGLNLKFDCKLNCTKTERWPAGPSYGLWVGLVKNIYDNCRHQASVTSEFHVPFSAKHNPPILSTHQIVDMPWFLYFYILLLTK